MKIRRSLKTILIGSLKDDAVFKRRIEVIRVKQLSVKRLI